MRDAEISSEGSRCAVSQVVRPPTIHFRLRFTPANSSDIFYFAYAFDPADQEKNKSQTCSISTVTAVIVPNVRQHAHRPHLPGSTHNRVAKTHYFGRLTNNRPQATALRRCRLYFHTVTTRTALCRNHGPLGTQTASMSGPLVAVQFDLPLSAGGKWLLGIPRPRREYKKLR